MPTKVTVKQLRSLLRVGTEFIGTFTGSNASRCVAGMQRTKRRVVKNTPRTIISLMLDGPHEGAEIDLELTGVQIEHRGNSYYLRIEGEEFLCVTILLDNRSNVSKSDDERNPHVSDAREAALRRDSAAGRHALEGNPGGCDELRGCEGDGVQDPG